MNISITAIFSSIATILAMPLMAQVHQPIDPAGYIIKYDPNFNSIGPEVYFLPAPIPKMADLEEQYSEIAPFFEKVNQQLRLNSLAQNFLFTKNKTELDGVLINSNDSSYENIIAQALAANNSALSYGAMNSYAKELILQEKITPAIEQLKKALLIAEQYKLEQDIPVLLYNLTQVLIHNQNFQEALQLELANMQLAIKEKNQLNQAHSLLNQAKIMGLKKEYAQAENTIIRKAFPLFNRTKNLEGKAKALVLLAEIYRDQQKYTEAQWFLLQARDIAHDKGIQKDFAQIEYLLGSSKFNQANYSVAKNELQTALQFAINENNQLLQLAIMDRLGRIALLQNQLVEANEQLKSYWQLRKVIFE